MLNGSHLVLRIRALSDRQIFEQNGESENAKTACQPVSELFIQQQIISIVQRKIQFFLREDVVRWGNAVARDALHKRFSLEMMNNNNWNMLMSEH